MMQLIKQRGYTCVIASLAMVWKLEFDQVVNLFGHDGTELTFPGSRRPEKGIHSQEVLDVALKRGYAMVVIQFYPVQGPGDGKGERLVWYKFRCQDRFHDYLINCYSVLIGKNKEGRPHAVAFDGLQVYDPDKGIYSTADFEIREAWQFHRIL